MTAINLKNEIKKALKKEGILKEMKELNSGLFIFYDRENKEVVISVTAKDFWLYNYETIDEDDGMKYRYDNIAKLIIKKLKGLNALDYTIYIQRQFKGW